MPKKKNIIAQYQSPSNDEIIVQQNLIEKMNTSLQKTVSSFSSRLTRIRDILSKI